MLLDNVLNGVPFVRAVTVGSFYFSCHLQTRDANCHLPKGPQTVAH